jgi:RNA-directed DNA polymerase
MLRSRSNTLVSVRQVTERNAGRLTPGVDGQVALTSVAKARLVAEIQRPPRRAWPVRRVHTPKADGKKLRPLGIPVIADRCLQALVLGALEPEWEARFEPRSYGFVRHEARSIEGGERPSPPRRRSDVVKLGAA